MIIYVLKNEAGDYLCYDVSYGYGVFYPETDYKAAMHYGSWQEAKADAEASRAFGKFDLYRWVITEEKDEE